ncbi:hypothetical protein LWI28_015959 [Acer negundo]|uniref:Uncharacterized protein n=1 Tax=Acer negundo TaxID=4023 RepID=A0AAD5IAL7_ACENE|nr:hypothetical protein LWI28_015959 [Acer negundo]
MSAADPPFSSTDVGLGYGIAIAVSIIVLISIIMLASYACIRVKANGVIFASITGGDNGGLDVVEPVVFILGLDGPIIESYPKIALGESVRLPRPNNGPCSICLREYKVNDTVRHVSYDPPPLATLELHHMHAPSHVELIELPLSPRTEPAAVPPNFSTEPVMPMALPVVPEPTAAAPLA